MYLLCACVRGIWNIFILFRNLAHRCLLKDLRNIELSSMSRDRSFILRMDADGFQHLHSQAAASEFHERALLACSHRFGLRKRRIAQWQKEKEERRGWEEHGEEHDSPFVRAENRLFLPPREEALPPFFRKTKRAELRDSSSRIAVGARGTISFGRGSIVG